ncbi:MAG: valine--tRNA ligase, partial [Gemmatimonadetes bacterium]|nr:valine--tRNA ligase [Gemmatimonadota bacterium]
MSISAPSSPSVTAPDDFPAQYDPASTEPAIYERWVAAGCFTADPARTRAGGGDLDPFGIFMPPPNVTAILHVGHGLN